MDYEANLTASPSNANSVHLATPDFGQSTTILGFRLHASTIFRNKVFEHWVKRNSLEQFLSLYCLLKQGYGEIIFRKLQGILWVRHVDVPLRDTNMTAV